MATLPIQEELSKINTDRKFLLLGDETFYKAPENRQEVDTKLSRILPHYKNEFWGTLGNFNDNEITWKGDIYHSKLGQLQSKGITQQVKMDLIRATGTNNLNDNTIRERYISFDAVDFGELREENSALRLTVFLNANEGALVYYQHFDTDEMNPESVSHMGFDYDFIFPEATKDETGEVDFNTHKRDRLSYEIDILPKTISADASDPEVISKLRFVVKILTFKREAASNENLLARSEEKLFGSNKRYKLMVFDMAKDEFVAPALGTAEIYPDQETLFLIHGTFVDTANSYESILKKNGGPSLLKKYLSDSSYKHKQAIAFNHPTLFDDAAENTKHLMDALEAYQQGFAFAKPVDLVGTSRGALVAKFLAIEFDAKDGNNTKIPVGNIATVSGANGCGYLTKGKYFVNTFLKLLKKGTPVQVALVSLAQLSVKYITTRSGLVLMTPGSAKLDYILNYQPTDINAVEVLTLSADFKVTKSKKLGKKIKNFFLRISDAVVQTMLGRQHDFVIGTPEQQISNPFPAHTQEGNRVFNAVHGKLLAISDKPWNLIVNFFNR